MSAGDFDGSGFLKGALVGSALNQASALAASQQQGLNNLQTIRYYEDLTDHLYDGGIKLVNSLISTKGDFEGVRSVNEQLLAAIREVDPQNSLLLTSTRDLLAGEASRLVEESGLDDTFVMQKSRRAGLQAIHDACLKELHRLNPGHVLVHAEERFSLYWKAFLREIDKRNRSKESKMAWAANGDVTPHLKFRGEYYKHVREAWTKVCAERQAAGPK